MFSSGSVKVMGGFFAFGAVVMALVGNALRQDENARVGGWVMIGVGVIMGVIASACLIEKGRAITGRITSAVGCLVCLGIFIGGVRTLLEGGQESSIDLNKDTTLVVKSSPIGWIFICAILGLGSAYYTVYGRFPSEWTFEEIFRRPDWSGGDSKRKSKKPVARKTKIKKPLRPLDE